MCGKHYLRAWKMGAFVPPPPLNYCPIGWCECGCLQKTALAVKTSARFGHVQGMPMRFILGHQSVQHGHARHKEGRSHEYISWSAMRLRCSPDCHIESRHIYFDRGIRVCSQWLDFSVFLADMGPRPSAGYTLDRIDNEKGYEPGNVQWADKLTQRANQRSRTPYGPRKRDPRWATLNNPSGEITL